MIWNKVPSYFVKYFQETKPGKNHFSMIVICKNMTCELLTEQRTGEDTDNTVADLDKDKPVYTCLLASSVLTT